MHPAGASRPEGPKVWTERTGERGRIDRESAPISGQSPANFGACQILPRSTVRAHPLPLACLPPGRFRARPLKPMLRGIARFCTLPLFRCRIFPHACRILTLSLSLVVPLTPPLSSSVYLSLSTTFVPSTNQLTNPPGEQCAMEGLCIRSRRKTTGDDCGLRPRKNRRG